MAKDNILPQTVRRERQLPAKFRDESVDLGFKSPPKKVPPTPPSPRPRPLSLWASPHCFQPRPRCAPARRAPARRGHRAAWGAAAAAGRALTRARAVRLVRGEGRGVSD